MLSDLYKETQQIHLETLGPKHPSYATTLCNLAVFYQSMGAYEKAEPLYKETAQIQLEVLGPKHPEYAVALGNFAGLYESMGAYEKAEPLYKETQQIQFATLGPKHPQYAITLGNFSGLYIHMGANSKALELLQEAWDITRSFLSSSMAVLPTRDRLSSVRSVEGFLQGYVSMASALRSQGRLSQEDSAAMFRGSGVLGAKARPCVDTKRRCR